jgi:hypothetical protein
MLLIWYSIADPGNDAISSTLPAVYEVEPDCGLLAGLHSIRRGHCRAENGKLSHRNRGIHIDRYRVPGAPAPPGIDPNLRKIEAGLCRGPDQECNRDGLARAEIADSLVTLTDNLNTVSLEMCLFNVDIDVGDRCRPGGIGG